MGRRGDLIHIIRVVHRQARRAHDRDGRSHPGIYRLVWGQAPVAHDGGGLLDPRQHPVEPTDLPQRGDHPGPVGTYA